MSGDVELPEEETDVNGELQRSESDLPVCGRPRYLGGGTILRSISRMCGELHLDRLEAAVGETVIIRWEIGIEVPGGLDFDLPVPSERDWIGLFRIEDLNPESFLDYRMRGENLADRGQIQWLLSTEYLTDMEYRLCFCFYTNTNVLIAQSNTMVVTNPNPQQTIPTVIVDSHLTNEPIPIKIQGVHCENLRVKTFGSPDPFIKIKITPGRNYPRLNHHNQLPIVTRIINNTVSPSWDEEFDLRALSSDVLELEVRDKFSFSRPSASHFMGKTEINLLPLEQEETFTAEYPLRKRLPTDRVSGEVILTISKTNIHNENTPHQTTHETNVTMETSEPHPLSILQEDQEEIGDDQPPERPADRIQWVRRTLHGDTRRRNPHRYSNYRHSSLSARPTPHYDFTTSLSVMERVNSPKRTDSLTESLPQEPIVSNGQAVNVGLEQFIARASRNQLMRQHSHPVERRPHHQGLEPEPYTETETSTSESRTETDDIEQKTEPGSLFELQPVSSNVSILVLNTSVHNEKDNESTQEPREQGVNNNTVTTGDEGDSISGMSLTVSPSFSRMDSVDDSLRSTPAFRFLTRKDFYEYAKEVGNTCIFEDLHLLQLIQSIRSDHSLLNKYINSSKLVRALNSFALTKYELPDGWERKLDRKSNKAVFIDHNTHTTTFIDPRLPYPGIELKHSEDQKTGVMRTRPVYNAQRSPSNPIPPQSVGFRTQRSATAPPGSQLSIDVDDSFDVSHSPPPPLPPRPPLEGASNYDTVQSYSGRVVAFLRQPDIFTILNTRYEEDISLQLRESIELIRSEGVPALESLQNESEDIYFELAIILSLFEEDIAHQFFLMSDSPPLPAPVTTSPPPVAADNAVPSMNLDSNEYSGIPLSQIIEFFQLPNVYNIVLTRFGSIQPNNRSLIVEFAGALTFELAETLAIDRNARRFVHQLREDILRNVGSGDTPDSDFPTAQEVRNFFSQHVTFTASDNIILDPDERSIVQVCGTWDVSLIDFELNRDSVLRALVERLATRIKEYSRSSVPSPPQTITSESLGAASRSPSHSPSRSPSPPPSSRSDSSTPPGASLQQIDRQLPHHRPPPSDVPQKQNQKFVRKLQQLQSLLDTNGYASSSYSSKKFNLRRDHLLEDSYRIIMSSSAKTLRAKHIHVTWDQEEGLDYGGPQREFFFKLSRHLFNPYYGLFEYTSHGAYTVQISRFSSQIEDSLQWFRFAGRVIGYSIIQNNLLDVFFARHFYKSLLGRPYAVSDVEALDIAFYNSLKYVLDDDPTPLELTFTVTEESFGELVEKELKPGGAKIPVTNKNKKHYIDLMVQWKLCHGVQQQIEALVNGLKEMIPLEYLGTFDAQEFEWVIAGTPEIDMEDWKANTQYWGGYSATHLVIKYFWEVIESCTDEQKLRFLQFVTGTSSIPYEGFKALRGSSQQLQKFTIDRHTGSLSSLPIAHTCFNRVDIPPYRSKDEMKEKILFAILETDSFENA